jgi:hypothetical protein
MPLALVALAVLVASNVVLGPLGLGVIQWRVSTIGLNQTYGADGAALVLIVPTALAAAWLWQRHHRLAGPLALGVGLATLYYAIASALGPDYVRYSGNNERFFLLLLALVILSWNIARAAWAALDARPPAPARGLARMLGSVLLVGGVAVGLAWTRQLLDITIVGSLSGADALAYADAPGAFWLVRVVDLGFIVPLCVAVGVGLWRGNPTAIKAAYGITAFMTIQAASVLAMGTVMLWHQDPTATPVLVLILAPVSAALVVLNVRLLASYTTVALARKTTLTGSNDYPSACRRYFVHGATVELVERNTTC